jgi:sugar phosphate isomerase/epimerase
MLPLDPSAPEYGWQKIIYLAVPLSYFWDENQTDVCRLIAKLPVNLELGLDWMALDYYWPSKQKETRRLFAGRNLTVHMPFMGLAPATPDPMAAEAALTRLRQAVKTALALQSSRAVLHLGYDYRFDRDREKFITLFCQRMAPIIAGLTAGGCQPVLENVFEPDPSLLLEIRRRFCDMGQYNVGFCLDVGHALAFSSTDLPQWWEAFAPWLREMHLHDNPGYDDLHQAIGSGKVDFAYLGQVVNGMRPGPQFTLELRDEASFWQSLYALHQLWGPATVINNNESQT